MIHDVGRMKWMIHGVGAEEVDDYDSRCGGRREWMIHGREVDDSRGVQWGTGEAM